MITGLLGWVIRAQAIADICPTAQVSMVPVIKAGVVTSLVAFVAGVCVCTVEPLSWVSCSFLVQTLTIARQGEVLTLTCLFAIPLPSLTTIFTQLVVWLAGPCLCAPHKWYEGVGGSIPMVTPLTTQLCVSLTQPIFFTQILIIVIVTLATTWLCEWYT